MSAPAASDAPLLAVDRLTLRFRGLTAVDAVDLRVQKGEIFAVIGPNGAGKTSLFNAITGIYEPTEGTVRLSGRDLRSSPTRRTYLSAALVGLSVGFLMFLVACDINQMWSAVVKANYVSEHEGFQTRAAWVDLGSFIAARPRIERRTGRYYVTTSDGKAPFGSAKTRAEAEAKRAALPEIAALPADGSTIEPREDRFAILSLDRQRVLDEAPTREVAGERLAAAGLVLTESATAVRTRILALLFGIAIGTAGAWAVWQQSRRTPSSVASAGIARTFQNIRLFQDMTVIENVLVGMDRHLVSPRPRLSRQRLADAAPLAGLATGFGAFWLGQRLLLWPLPVSGALLAAVVAAGIVYLTLLARSGHFSKTAREVEDTGRRDALELLGFVGLRDRAEDLARNLPYGDQRRLEIARSLATRPTLLLLDEPAAGMNPAETVALMKLIRSIRDRGVTVLLIEHHMRVVMGISDRIAVLVYGAKVAEGKPEEIRLNPRVIEAYLGQEQLG